MAQYVGEYLAVLAVVLLVLICQDDLAMAESGEWRKENMERAPA